MSHGEKMSVLGKIIALQEVMIHTQNEINKLNATTYRRQRDGSNKASTNRSRDDLVCAGIIKAEH